MPIDFCQRGLALANFAIRDICIAVARNKSGLSDRSYVQVGKIFLLKKIRCNG